MIRRRALGYLQVIIPVFGALTQNAQGQVEPADPQKAIRNYFSDRLKDPDSAQYRLGDLYYCRDGALSSLSIRGTQWAMDVSVNAKNSFGGYVGYQGYLMLFDGDRIASADAGYSVGSTLTAACSHARSLAAASGKVQLFSLPKLPTAVVQTQCHMGQCTWEQITSISDVKQHGSEVLRTVHSRSTTTETPEGQDYPTALDTHMPVTWRKSAWYVLCSLKRPTFFWWDASERSYIETPLHVVSPFGYETSAVTEYLMACHGAKSGSNEAKHPAELGYVDRTDDMPQSQIHIADPKQVFGSYR